MSGLGSSATDAVKTARSSTSARPESDPHPNAICSFVPIPDIGQRFDAGPKRLYDRRLHPLAKCRETRRADGSVA